MGRCKSQGPRPQARRRPFKQSSCLDPSARPEYLTDHDPDHKRYWELDAKILKLEAENERLRANCGSHVPAFTTVKEALEHLGIPKEDTQTKESLLREQLLDLQMSPEDKRAFKRRLKKLKEDD